MLPCCGLSGAQLGSPAEIPPELGNLSNLQALRFTLNYNELSGPIPPELGLLANLEELDLSRQPVERPDTAGTGQASPTLKEL